MTPRWRSTRVQVLAARRHTGLFTFPESAKHVALYQKLGCWPPLSYRGHEARP